MERSELLGASEIGIAAADYLDTGGLVAERGHGCRRSCRSRRFRLSRSSEMFLCFDVPRRRFAAVETVQCFDVLAGEGHVESRQVLDLTRRVR